MQIGIVTTWFERGAAYVSRQYMEVLEKEHNVFIYARSGESYAIGNSEWDLPNVHWSKKINSPFSVTVIDKKEFVQWIKKNDIQAILFNEQHWWEPLVWCQELGVKTIAYVDYYTEKTVPLFGIYDMLICNTKKHFEAFKWHYGAKYIPWGTNVDLFKPIITVNDEKEKLVFFHSCGMNPLRKGTDLLIKAIEFIDSDNFKVIIHSQLDLKAFYPDLSLLIDKYQKKGKLEIIFKTVNAPGLYYLGDVYVYPSRLEGIGLTVVEAISSGLGIIVPDCGPMNEFVDADFGELVKIDKYFSRHDGYYWPQNEVLIEDLAEKMEVFITKNAEKKKIKLLARKYAEVSLNWDANTKELPVLFSDNLKINSNNAQKAKAISLIKKYENYGLRKYNKLYLKFPLFFNMFLKKR